MRVTTLGSDLAKSVFQLHGGNEDGKVAVQKRGARSKLPETAAQFPRGVSGMEACGSAQDGAREFQKLGHTVKLLGPQFVKPYGKGHKTDSRDAEAIGGAGSRPHRRFISLKTMESQASQAIPRMRSRLIKDRTALVNQVRGLLGEHEIVIAQGSSRLRQHLPTIVEDLTNELTPLSREGMRELSDQLVALDGRIAHANRLVQRVFAEKARGQKLAQGEGSGPVIPTALVAAVDTAQEFAHGRPLAAWRGLVPRQCSSGGKEQLLGISKRRVTGTCRL